MPQTQTPPERVVPENKMGTMPVNRLLLTMAIPMMISMLVQALYNVVDSMYVSRLSENALNAVSLAFPMQNFMIAVGSGTGVGINALLSKSLGERKQETADKAAGNGLFLAACSSVFFLLLGLFCVPAYMHAQTDVEEIYRFGCDYLRVCLICAFACMGQITFERLLQATGKTVFPMISQGTGAIVNIILDPIMIFTLEMGVTGAAVATVCGQLVGLILGLVFNLKKNPDIRFSWKTLQPRWEIIRKIYAVGLPSVIMVSISSVLTFFMNIILKGFEATATAVFGVYFKLQSFVFMPVFGLNNAMVPIVAYNYGAKIPERIIRTVKYSVCYAVGMMLIGLLIFQTLAKQLLLLFVASDNMLTIGVPALRTISLSFVFAGFCIVAGSVFQALGKGLASLAVSVVRQLVVLLPAAYLLSLTGRLANVWWAFPIAELFSLALSGLFLLRIYRQEIRPLAFPPAPESGPERENFL